jgi:hypothetical protein
VPSGFGQVDRDAEVDVGGGDHRGLAVDLVVVDVLARELRSVFTIAHAMRCVNDTLPPRARLRWLLMTMRLSIMSLAGMVRTLVAVGTVRLWSMLVASDFAACRGAGSRLVVRLGWARLPEARGGRGFRRDRLRLRAWSEVVRATGWLPVAFAVLRSRR